MNHKQPKHKMRYSFYLRCISSIVLAMFAITANFQVSLAGSYHLTQKKSSLRPQSTINYFKPSSAGVFDEVALDVNEIISFHNQFQQLVQDNIIGQETPEGYRVSLREIIRIADFIKQHKHLKPNLALAWALRGIYYKRLQSDKDKDTIKHLIYSMAALQGIDLEPIFDEPSDELDRLISQYGYQGAYLIYHTKGDLPKEIQSILIHIAQLLNKQDDLSQESAILSLPALPAELAFAILDVFDIKTPEHIEALGQIAVSLQDDTKKIQTLDKLTGLFNDRKWSLRDSAAKAFGLIASSIQDETQKIKVLDKLTGLFNHNEWYVRRSAAEASGQIAPSIQDETKKIKVLDKLIGLFNDSDAYIRRSAAEASGLIASSIQDENKKIEVLDKLTGLFNNNEWYVRRSAAEAYGQIASLIQDETKKIQTLDKLTELFSASVLNVRASAAKAYGQIAASIQDETKKIQTLDKLTELFNDSDAYVRRSAARSYSQIAPSIQDETKKIQTLDKLTGLLNDRKWSVRDSAAKAFGQIAPSIQDETKKIQTLDKLTELFNDSDAYVRRSAAKSYSQIAASLQDETKKIQTVNKLTELFNDRDEYVRRSVAQAFGLIAQSILAPHKTALEAVYHINRARFIETHSTNIQEIKRSPYKIEVDRKNNLIKGIILKWEKGKIVEETTVITQPILGTIDEEALKSQNIILNPDTIRDLIDMMFFTSQDKLIPLFLLGPTATGKTSKIRYLSALAGKMFLRVQINSQTDELDLLGHFMPKGLSISYEEAASLIQEHLDTNQISKLQYALSLLLPTYTQKQNARKDPEFTKRQIQSALYLKQEQSGLIRAIGHILLHGTSNVELVFKKAHFLEALERGDWILLDEINLAREESLGIIYGLLTRGYLDFNGKRIYPKEKHGMLFAAGNPSSDAGRQLFSEALENRFQLFYTPPMRPSQTAGILFDKYPIEGLGFADIEGLVELNYTLDRLMQTYAFEGFENERPYPFTIRNIENILKNTQTRLNQKQNTLTSHQALIKEIFIEYSDILKRSPKNIAPLTDHIKASFSEDTDIPKIDISFAEESKSLDNIALPAPEDKAHQDKSLIPDKDMVNLILTDSTLDTTRAIFYGFNNPRRPVMLLGQTAAGKTETVANTARILGWQYHSENLRDAPLSSLIGTWSRNLETGILDFKDGILIEAMTKGYCLVLEEINFMDTGLLEIISEWIDEGCFTNPKTHEKVKIHSDFRLFATLNPIQGTTRISLGRNVLPAPFINRFKLVWVNEKDETEQFIILKDMLERAGIKTKGSIKEISGHLKPVTSTYEKPPISHTHTVSSKNIPIKQTTPPASLPAAQGQQPVKSLAVTGAQYAGTAYQSTHKKPEPEETEKDKTYNPERELSQDELTMLLEEIEKDPAQREALRDKIKEYHSFFERVTSGRIRISPGNIWAYIPKQETLIYPVRDILETDNDTLVGIGIHEGMHRYGTRYIDFMPFLDKLTNLLFNAAEDVAIENWAGHLIQGSPKYFEKVYEVMDSEEWLSGRFGEDIPEHIKFVFGILYYGKRGTLPDILKGKARDALEADEIKQALDEVFDALPKIRDENGNIRINKEPTPMEIMAAAKLRVEIMREKILPVYKKLLAERANELSKGGCKLEQGDGKGEGEPIDLDSLPEDLRRQLEKELEKYAKELDDRTKEGSKSWEDAQKEKKGKQQQAQRQREQRDADRLTQERLKREEEDRRLSDAEKFARKKAFEDRIKGSFSQYQLNLDTVRRLVHMLTGQMANIIREDTSPRWQSGLRKGKDIDWDRFFISAMSGFSDDKYWRDRIIPQKRGIKFTLVIDESSSMSGKLGENAILAAIVFMDVLQNLGIDFNVRGFGNNTYLHKSFRNQLIPGTRRVYDTLKERNELIEELSVSMATGVVTADGDALMAAVDDMKNYGSEQNIIIVLSDGEGNKGMPVSEALEEAGQLGIKVIGIGIGEGIQYVAKHYKHHVQIPNIEMLPVEFKRILRKEIESISKSSSAGTNNAIEQHEDMHVLYPGSDFGTTTSIFNRSITRNAIDSAA